VFNSLTRLLYRAPKRYIGSKAGKFTISKDITKSPPSTNHESYIPEKLEPITTENLNKEYKIRQVKEEQKLATKSLKRSDWKLLDQLMSNLIITSMFIVSIPTLPVFNCIGDFPIMIIVLAITFIMGISSCVVYYTVKTTLRIKNQINQTILALIEKLEKHKNSNGKLFRTLNLQQDLTSNATITNKNVPRTNKPVSLIGEYNARFTPLITSKLQSNSKVFNLENSSKTEPSSERMKYFPFVKPFLAKHRWH
jgi:hypothetical protein